mmetsp:Transcript_9386/g.19211  ORF Transcript_9386/g.19211 Transcript_9386/m.19211 type:complete len:264 (-) Transcript_9386:316-1107(-)
MGGIESGDVWMKPPLVTPRSSGDSSAGLESNPLGWLRSSSRDLFGSYASSLDAFTSVTELRRAEDVQKGREEAKEKGALERMHIFRGLLPYLCPLFVVFWAAYACQSGAWTAFALPTTARLDSIDARETAYQFYNLMYQVGVFISRSSGLFIVVPRKILNVLVVVQVALLAWFGANAAMQMQTGYVLGAPSFLVGLIGGTLYVQMFMAIDREVAEDTRETALATCTCGDTAGILAGEFTGWAMQLCLFDYLGLSAHHGSCPLT